MDLTAKLSDTQCSSIKSLANNPTSDAILFFFAWRKRYSRVTDLDILKKEVEKEGFKLDMNDYKSFFTELEKSKFGVMKYGREPNLMGSFVWDYSLRTIGKVMYPSTMVQDKDKISRIIKSKQALPPPAPPKPVPSLEVKPKFGGRPRGARNKPKPTNLVLPGLTLAQARILQELWATWSKS